MPDANNRYVRAAESRVWHWHTACQHYRHLMMGMHSTYKGVADKPTYGELCNECQTKDKEDEKFP